MKCQFIKSDNTQCRANHIKDSTFCFRHDPTSNEARIVASSKGGQNRVLQGVYGEKVKLTSPTDIRKFLGTVINGVWTGQVPVPVGSSMGFLAKCWLEAHSASEIQARLEGKPQKPMLYLDDS